MFTYHVSYPFRIERIGKEFFQRNGQQQQLESDLPTPPQKLHFRIGSNTFIPPWVQPNQTAPNLPIFAANFFAQQLFFARLARPIQQIFILRSISRDKTSELHRKKKLKLGRSDHKWSSNISPRNWLVKFKAITPVVNFSTNFFIPLLNFVEFSSTVKFCCGTWKLRQVGKLRTTKVTNVLIKIVLNAIYDYFYTRTKLFDFYR